MESSLRQANDTYQEAETIVRQLGLEEDLANVLKNLEIVELIRAQLDIAPESK